MFKSNLIRVMPSFPVSFLEKVVSKSAEITNQKLYIFSEENLSPEMISKIYQKKYPIDMYFLCCGIPLHEYPELDDIDLYISPFNEHELHLNDLQSRIMHWKRTRFMHMHIDETFSEKQHLSSDSCVYKKIHKFGVLGGTFDDLHIGHKLLLSSASTLCSEKLLIGVTHEKLLSKKKFAVLVQSFEKRVNSVSSFLKIINPTLDVKIVPISDPIGPSGTEPDLDLLISSQETASAVYNINKFRSQRGLNELESYCIDLIHPTGACDKISSSNRRKDMFGKLIPRNNIPWLRRSSDKSRLKLQELPYVVGLTGGICSGKSTISEYIRNKGIETIDCDKIGHEVYQPGQIAYKQLVKEFGYSIVSADESIDRKALGQLVFNDSVQMKRLTDIVWPCIANAVCEIIESSNADIIAVEAAVLIEAGWKNLVDEVWVMKTSPEIAKSRLMERNNLTPDDAEKRIASQLTNLERCSHADIIICSDWEHKVTQSYLDSAWLNLNYRLKYYKLCHNSNSIEEKWKYVRANACANSIDYKWLDDILRTERSKSFLEIALTAIDETLDLSRDKHLVLYTAVFFLATTLHVQNSSMRAFEAMFKMFCEGNHVSKIIADEIMDNIKVSSNLLKKAVACSEFNLLFKDIWMRATIFCTDEGDQRILPSIFTTEKIVNEQKILKCELSLRLLEGNKHIFKTDYFKKNFEEKARDKIRLDLENFSQEECGELIISDVRKSIGYNLQEY